MNNNPLVSIVIPVYNGGNYLAEAIDSALAQSYKNVEIIVINDGSTDDGLTRNVALNYGNRIRYHEKENGGVASALNLGIKEMRGDYFSWLSHDDVYEPNKIEAQIEFLVKIGDNNSILYSDFCYIDERSNFIRNFNVKPIEPQAFRLYFIMGGIIHGCTLLIPTACFEKCGMFNTNLRTTQDYDLWFRFSEQFNFIHLRKILIKSRLHPNQDTSRLRPLVVKECNEISLYFIKSIRRAEISAAYPKPIPIYYFDFAKSMMRQRYSLAMKYSLYLGLLNINHLRIGFISDYVKSAIVLIKEVIKTYLSMWFGLICRIWRSN